MTKTEGGSDESTHCFMSPGAEQLKDREYLGTITNMKLNADYAAVLFEGRVQLHLVRFRLFDLISSFS